MGAGSDVSGGETGTTLSRNDRFDLLSNHRRRYAIHYLRQNGGEASLGELADTVAAWENEISPDAVSYDQRKRVYTSLQQVHLPRMDDMGVVEFDERDGAVEVGPAVENLDIYLEVVEGWDVPWSTFYLGLALLSAAVLGFAALGVPLLEAVAPFGLAVFVVTAFLVTSLAHLYLTKTEMELGANEKPPEIE